MTKRGPYQRRKQLADRNRGLCACGEHAWAVLTKGYVTFVSPEDAHHLSGVKWQAFCSGTSTRLLYAARTLGWGKQKKLLLLHRLILGELAGDEADVDHRDRNSFNNRRSNLRTASRSQNLGNGLWPRNIAGFRGVARMTKSPRWRARLAGKHLGTFTTPEEAARAYDAAAIERFGEFATLNFPVRTTGARL